jgi:hypothetical protein
MATVAPKKKIPEAAPEKRNDFSYGVVNYN